MDSQANGTCPTCGHETSGAHTCPEAEKATGDIGWSSTNFEDTGRIAVPEALRNTGLFRAAWKPSAPQEAPQTLSNIFERVEDAPASARDPQPVAAPSPATEPAAPVVAADPNEESSVNEQNKDGEHDPFAGVAPEAPAAPEPPVDPWAGLDTTVTDGPDESSPVEDPWAHLEPQEPVTPPAPEVAADPFGDAAFSDAAFGDAASDGQAPVVETDPGAGSGADFGADPFDLYGEPDPEVADVAQVAEAPESAEAVEAVEDAEAEVFAAEEPAAEHVPVDEAPLDEAPADEQDAWDEAPADEAGAEHAPQDEAVQDVAEDEAPEEQAPEDEAPTGAIDLAATSPIAATEAAAIAAGYPAPLPPAPVQPGTPAQDETVAIDQAEAFEDAPATNESAYDLYGENLYAPAAPEQDLAPDPFSTGLSEAGITSASLPSSVPFAPEADALRPAADADPAERRSRTGLIAAAVAILLVVGAGAWWWTGTQKDAPVKDAFAASHKEFTAASNQLANASTIAEIAAAGGSFESAVSTLAATEDKTRTSDSDVSVAARRATAAEKAVAEAAAPLKELTSADLSSWAAAKEPLDQSVKGLAGVKDDIEAAGGDTSSLLSTDIVTSLQTVIADEVVSGAGETVTDLSAKLEAASLLADVRAVGTSAGEYVTPLGDAAKGLDDEQKRSDLNSVVEFHEALSGLSKVRSATFAQWPDIKKDIDDAIEDLAENQEEARAGLAAADALITEAEKKFTAWETKHADAKAKKAQDTADLEAATKAVSEADTTFATLRAELENVTKEVRGLPAEGREGEAFKKLDAAATAREELLSTLQGLTLTPRPAEKLQVLVDVLDKDAKAVRAAADAAAGCTEDCRLTDTAGWKGLAEGTRSSGDDWAAALPEWDAAAQSAAEKIKARELPKRPKI